jgi:hypothetical protein
MLWRIKDGPLAAPLATTSAPGSLGVLGASGTTVILGSNLVNFGNFNGSRWTAGFSGPEELVGLEFTGFFLEKHSRDLFPISSDAAGAPVINRPIIDVTTGQETNFPVSAPGALSGTLGESLSSRMWGAEANGFGSLYRSLRFNADILLGFRFLELEESLEIDQNSTVLENGTAGFGGSTLGPGSNLSIIDRFGTRNDFYGGQIGLQTEVRLGEHFFVYLVGKTAFGTNHESINNFGSTSQNLMGSPVTTLPGGLLVLRSNAGHFSKDEFAVVPEGGMNVGWQITHHICLSVGYTFLYCSSVIRPGDQIDRVVNPGLVPASLSFGSVTGPAVPTVHFRQTDFWAFGVSAGLSIRF